MSTQQATSKTDNEAELRAIVGRNADYYLARWRRSKRAGLNLAAFFIAGLWLPYRKMHRETAALFSLLLLQSISSDLVGASGIMRPETPRRLQIAVTIAVAWICATYGNVWYRSHVNRVIGAVRQVEPDESQRLTLLAARGGTSVRSALVWSVAAVVTIGIISSVLRRALGLPEGTN
jgi:Protein of unknown function (DUF2628)